MDDDHQDTPPAVLVALVALVQVLEGLLAVKGVEVVAMDRYSSEVAEVCRFQALVGISGYYCYMRMDEEEAEAFLLEGMRAVEESSVEEKLRVEGSKIEIVIVTASMRTYVGRGSFFVRTGGNVNAISNMRIGHREGHGTGNDYEIDCSHCRHIASCVLGD